MAAPPDLLARAESLGWYHTLELAPGHVTPGMFDMRPYVDGYGIPERLDGLRARLHALYGAAARLVVPDAGAGGAGATVAIELPEREAAR